MRGNNTLPFHSAFSFRFFSCPGPWWERNCIPTQTPSPSWTFLAYSFTCLHIIFYVTASIQAQKDLRGIGVALWHKQGNLLLFDAGQAGRVLAESWAEFTESVSRVLAEENTRVMRCERVRGGQAPRCGQAMHQSWVHIFFILFPGGVFRHFFLLQPSWGVFFLLLMDSTLHHSHYS